MARETREERVVRTMIPQLTEQLLELKTIAASSSRESVIETWCQSMLKSVLGFSASGGYQVRPQETRGNMRFDLIISRLEQPETIFLVVEVKKLGADLDKSDFRSGKTQLKEYLALLGGVRWGVLTNGYEWRLYDFDSDCITVASTELRDESQQLDVTPKGIVETAWDLIEFTSFYFEGKTWEKLSVEAQAFSPDSLARSILSIDVVKKIARNLKGEHDYRVPVDLLTDKLADLLERGLNDAVASWSDIQRTELDRYIRTQKKQAKRTRRAAQGQGESDQPTGDNPQRTVSQATQPSFSNVPISNTLKKVA